MGSTAVVTPIFSFLGKMHGKEKISGVDMKKETFHLDEKNPNVHIWFL